MKTYSKTYLVAAVGIAFAVGSGLGFLGGIAATKAGREFLEAIVAVEAEADIADPRAISRDRFELRYPSNWEIDVEDEDYDPDHMFSIDSPGGAFVLFVITPGETDPAENLAARIEPFEKLMGPTTQSPVESYGGLPGSGAILRGRIFGMPSTVKLFSSSVNGLTLMVTLQYTDEDEHLVEDGFMLIEESLELKSEESSEE